MEADTGKILRKCIFAIKKQLIFCKKKKKEIVDSDVYTALGAAHNCSQKQDLPGLLIFLYLKAKRNISTTKVLQT